MRRTLSLLVLLSATSLWAGDNAADQTKAHKEVQTLLARMAAAESAGDAVALGQCYENDGVLLPSSGQPVRGREGITKRYLAIFAGKLPRLPIESEELWVLDDLAVSRGTTRGPSPRKNVKGPIRNRYVMTLKRHGDAWEIHSLVWNSATATAVVAAQGGTP